MRPSAPRGSAELRPRARRSALRARTRTVRKETQTGSKFRRRHKRATLFVAALVPLTIAASIAALSHVGGTASRATSRAGSGRLATAAEIAPFVPTKIFGTLANLFASDLPRVGRHHTAPVERRRRKLHISRRPTPPHRAVSHTAAAPVVPTPPTNSAPASSSSSSAPASSSPSATKEATPSVELAVRDQRGGAGVELAVRDQRGGSGREHTSDPARLRAKRQPRPGQGRPWHPVRRQPVQCSRSSPSSATTHSRCLLCS